MKHAPGILAGRLALRLPILQFVEELLVASYMRHFDGECMEVWRQFAEARQLPPDGAGRCRAYRVCAVEGEVCLIQPPDREPIPHEAETAFFHVLLCLADPARRQQIVHPESGGSHLRDEVERFPFAVVCRSWWGRDRRWGPVDVVEQDVARPIADLSAHDVGYRFVQRDHLRRGKYLPSERTEGHIVMRPLMCGDSEGIRQVNRVEHGCGVGCESPCLETACGDAVVLRHELVFQPLEDGQGNARLEERFVLAFDAVTGGRQQEGGGSSKSDIDRGEDDTCAPAKPDFLDDCTEGALHRFLHAIPHGRPLCRDAVYLGMEARASVRGRIGHRAVERVVRRRQFSAQGEIAHEVDAFL